MSILDLSVTLSDALFVLIFLVVGVRAIRYPLRATADTALFFGIIAAFILTGALASALHAAQAPVVSILSQSLLIALPYTLLRLTADVAVVPRGVLRGAVAGLAAAVVGFILVPASARPDWLTLLYVAYFVGFVSYDVVVVVHAAQRASGVTRRRLRAVALGSGLLGVAILCIGLQAVAPAASRLWVSLEQLSEAGIALAYFVGFAPPRWLRRAWQAPEVTAFLRRAVRLTRLSDTRQIARELAVHAAEVLGAPRAVVYLWDAEAQVLRGEIDGMTFERAPGQMLSGRVFASQRPLFSADPMRDDPANAALYRAFGACAALIVPITRGETRLGVLMIYAARASIFAEDDLALAELLAEHIALVLDSQALAADAARVQAQAESTRLREEFLAAAAHDLKTPLTALAGWVQLLEQRSAASPGPPDPRLVSNIARSTRRMKQYVSDLLDAARLEHEQFVGPRERVDLAALAREVCAAHDSAMHPITLYAPRPVVGLYDAGRIAQVLENLLGNAVKYSPDGGPISVSVSQEGAEACLSVTDTGIGIPAADLPHLFERFRRGSNAEGTAVVGLGLGLYLCQRIVAEHGGQVWATSPGVGQGSSVHVRLPALTA